MNQGNLIQTSNNNLPSNLKPFPSPLERVSVRFLVLSDDITGAAEIAGVCLRYGLKVSFGINDLPGDADVRIVVTDSRSVSEEEAFQIHKTLALKIKNQSGIDFIFKKCDSVLRGYVLTEMFALADVFKKKSVLLQPTNPATGRCIKNGIYFIGDNHLHETGFAADPDFPAFSSSVHELLKNRTSKATLKNFPEILISDCASVDKLAEIASSCTFEMLACGSAAFSEQLLIRKFGLKKQEQNINKPIFKNNFLFISGSTHPSGNDFRAWMSQRNCPVSAIPHKLFSEKTDKNEFDNYCSQLINQYQQNTKKLIVYVDYQQKKQVLNPVKVKNVISDITCVLLDKLDARYVFIDGGATAFDIFLKLELRNFEPEAELAPGVVLLKSLDRDNLELIIKPGSYNWPKEYFVED